MTGTFLGAAVTGTRGARSASRVVAVRGAPGPTAAGAHAVPERAARERLVAWTDRVLALFWNDWLLFGLLAILAVLSGVWGFVSFYGPQYGLVPWPLWPFVPDSPIAVSAWLLAALALKMGWDDRPGAAGAAWAFFASWAAVWNAKVGLWTAFVLLHYHEVFFAPPQERQLFQAMLLVAHLGMVAFALLLFRKVRALPMVGYLGVLAVVFLWDFVDYFLVPLFMPASGIMVFPHGIPGDPERLRVTAAVAVGLSASMTALIALGIQLRGPPSPR